MKHFSLYLFLLHLTVSSCNKVEQIESVIAFDETKVIQEILPQRQVYSINANNDTILVTNSGSLVRIDSASFEDHYGNTVTGNIDIIIYEAITISEMLKANLSTVGEFGILESDGMIFINAFQDSTQLKIRENKELFISIPNTNLKSDMSLWRGVISNNTIMWEENDSIVKYLVPVDLELLDFSVNTAKYIKYIISKEEAPDGMTEIEAVRDGLILRDTLTLTIEQSSNKELVKKIKNSYPEDVLVPFDCGIPSKYLELIKTQKFENTLIATREFEYRMKFIHRTCDVEVLKLYIDNLDLNLWEIDSLVYKHLLENGNDYALQFNKFSKQKLTKVKGNQKLSKAIKRTIKSIDNLLQSDIEESRRKAEIFKTNNVFYQFEAKRLGWYNIDKYWKREDLQTIYLSVIIPEIKNIEKVQIHLTIPEDNVVIPLSKIPERNWELDSFMEPKLPLGVNGIISGIILNKKGEFFNLYKEFIIKESNTIEVKINKSSIEDISRMYDLVAPKSKSVADKPFDCCESIEQLDYSEEFF